MTDDSKLAELKECVAGMQGVTKPLANDLLAAYVQLFCDYEELNGLLASEGLVVEVVRGDRSQHVSRECHPAFNMRKSCISQMADLANKIKRFVHDCPEAEDDPLMDFINAG